MKSNALLQEVSLAHRARQMIGRDEAWEMLRATLEPGGPFRVVLIHGRGGLGKSRLLEHALRQLGREPSTDDEDEYGAPPKPVPVGATVIGDIVDVIDTHLHDRFQFVVELRNSLKRPYRAGLRFPRFDAQLGIVENLQASGALYERLIEEEKALVKAFVDDLRDITKERRVVFLVDTVERLSYVGPDWLLKGDILNPDDLEIRTHHWLESFIADPVVEKPDGVNLDLDNITLVLSGREQTDEVHPEGRVFFKRIRAAAVAAQEKERGRELKEIALKPLSQDATRAFFEQYAADWRDHAPRIAERYALATQEDRYKVIWLYTGGIPVRLALYAQLLAEGKTIPPALLVPYEVAWRRAGYATMPHEEIDESLPVPEKLLKARWEIEEQFVKLLFGHPGSLRQAMILSLLRAPRGLTAEQLHYVLTTNADKATWTAYFEHTVRERAAELNDYLALLSVIAADYWGRSRPPFEPLPDEAGHAPATIFRVALQDELYRIYAEHMGLFAEPHSPETKSIREMLANEEARYGESARWETGERALLYEKLAFFADHHYQQALEQKRAFLHTDEQQLEERFQLDNPESYSFRALSKRHAHQRLRLHKAQTFFEIERMIYRLLLHPEDNINSEYMTLEDDNDKAARHEEDFWAQAEMWRALFDDWLMKFVRMRPQREPARRREETPITVLRRVAEQESVARWIKRFVLRGSAKRGVEFSDRVKVMIYNLPRGDDGSPMRGVWRSWNHTLAEQEREVWTQVGRVRLGEVVSAQRVLETAIGKLEMLYNTPQGKPAATGSDYPEEGFAPREDGGQPHPGYLRLRRLLSHAYNHVGYSYRTLGRMVKAGEDYSRSLEYVRPESEKELMAHKALVLNNKSRTLSELGWDALGPCLDGLELRRAVAEEVPLAGSYNTLALIYDDMGRYEDAPLLSAKAIAYCRRASEKRQLGLSLRQMAESLRHVAERLNTGQRAASSPEQLFDTAEELLNQARDIFLKLGEVERQIEVNIELGSLFRDRLHIEPQTTGKPLDQQTRRLYVDEALNYLDLAERDARANNFGQHLIDAQVNQARVHFHAENVVTCEQILDALFAESVIQEHRIGEAWPAKPGLRDRNWAFRQLSVAHRLRGWIAFQRFEGQMKAFKGDYPGETTEAKTERARLFADNQTKPATVVAAKKALGAAAEAYALAYAYAVLYSPRSRTIGSLERDLFQRMRKFNRGELNVFRQQLEITGERYPMLADRSVSSLSQFFDEFFGRD
mgnify:CR=1 FL=1